MVYRKVYILIYISLNSIVSLIVSLGQFPPSRHSFITVGPGCSKCTTVITLGPGCSKCKTIITLGPGCPKCTTVITLEPGCSKCIDCHHVGAQVLQMHNCHHFGAWMLQLYNCLGRRPHDGNSFACVFANFRVEVERQPAVETKNATTSLVAPCNAPTDTNSNQALHT